MGIENIFFYWLAFVTVVTSVMVITLRNPLSCAFFLILFFVHLAGLFALLHAQFLAVAQILVYAGAIMVLFIFVIMLLNIKSSKWGILDGSPGQFSAVFVALTALVSLLVILWRSPMANDEYTHIALPQNFGSIEAVSRLLFVKYLVPFEIISILLLVATIGAVLLAKREI